MKLASPTPPPRPGVPARFADRLRRLRESMSARKLDGYLVLNRMDQLWLTGFGGEDGGVLVTHRAVTLLTDGRFDELADRQAPWARKVLRRQRGPESIARVIVRHRLRRLGFEPAHMNVAMYTALVRLIRPARLAAAGGLVLDMRQCKDEQEIAAIRRAIAIAQEAFTSVRDAIRPGVTEREVAALLRYEMHRRGAQEDAFPPIVAVGANASLPHAEAGDRVLRAGQAVLIDWGCRADGYVSDLTRMVWTHTIPPDLRRPYAAAVEAHHRAIEAVGPGVKAETVDRIAREVIRSHGFARQFTHALGHGIGLDVHEAPRLGRRSRDVLKPGMVVTIEPGVYLPGIGGVRVEDDVLVTSDGCQVLSSLPC